MRILRIFAVHLILINMITNKDFIHKLEQIAFLLELKEANSFKIKAFANAADKLKAEKIDIIDAVKTGKIEDIDGFGKSLISIANEYVNTSKISLLYDLAEEYPLSLYKLKNVKYLGIKRIKQLYQLFNITTLDELEEACLANKLLEIKGITSDIQERIFNSATHIKASSNLILQDTALQLADELCYELSNLDGISNVSVAGEVRRFAETISEITILIASKLSKLSYSGRAKVIIQEIEETGVKLNLIITDENSFFLKLNELSASGEFNSALYAKYPEIKSKSYSSEEDIYQNIGLQFIPPEIREDERAIELASQHKLPNLIENKDLKGMLHFHSNWSDGRNTLEEMIMECARLGFEYAAICDHSKYAAYANGLTEDRVLEQFDAIDNLNKQLENIKVIRGIESDILPDGRLDYDGDFLAQFDVVVASIHASFTLPKDEMTKRLVCAAENQYTTIIGHPTGRLLLTRAGYQIDIDKFIDACAANGKVIEMNANPYRLDFSYINARKALEKGVKLAINPDSHKVSTLADVYLGVKSARKAGLTKDDVINCLSYQEFIDLYSHRK